MEISFHRGDIHSQGFTVLTPDGFPCGIDFDEIYFTVKRSFDDQAYLFQKRLTRGEIIEAETGKYEFTIHPEDTDALSIGEYVFDIEIVDDTEGIKQTTTGKLKLLPEVTFASNES